MAAVHQGVPLILLEPLGAWGMTLGHAGYQNLSDDVIYDVRGCTLNIF
jgi:hypothetical protein